MIHFKFTRKNVRRLCVTMALIAPIVYLFGSLFFGLNGAHGVQLFADDPNTNVIVDDVHLDQNVWVNTENGEPFMVYGDYATSYKIALLPDSSVSYSFTNATSTWRVFFYSGDTFLRVVGIQNEGSLYDPDADSFRICSRGDDVSVRLTFTYSDGPSFASSVNFGDYVFGQFFARDNFVSKIGADAISETPHGFAPFGSLFRYVDQIAFHMGDTQVGLMAYGYMYWCAHVLLFDVLFMMTTFFISFIERVGDRLGGNE